MTFEAIKDPDAVLDYSIRWTDWLDGDEINASTWSITASESPTVLTVDSTSYGSDTTVSPNVANAVAKVWLSSGTVGITYYVTNHITTSAGREDDRTIAIKVQNK